MSRAFDPNDPELMDRPQPVSAELEADLLNLVSLNRYFGSHRLVRKFLELWLNPGRCYRVLDLCTGSGDLPRIMVDWARAREIILRIDAVDASEASLEIALCRGILTAGPRRYRHSIQGCGDARLVAQFFVE
jgi:hypothetical protein